jgi:uncharacterized protein (DUF427 family)
LYFPAPSIPREFFGAAGTMTLGGRNGSANYFMTIIDGVENRCAACYEGAPEPVRACGRGITVEP